MTRLYASWPRFAVAALVSIALTIAWGFVSTILVGVFQLTNQRATDYVTEALQIARDGTPVVNMTRIANGHIESVTTRTLDAMPWESKIGEHTGVSLASTSRLEPTPHSGASWSERIVGASDSQRRATNWYLVRQENPLGPAYFVGYDEISNLRVGYLGRSGFTQSVPPRDQWFDLPRRKFAYGTDFVCSLGYLAYGMRAGSYYSVYETTPPPEKGIRPWQVFLIDGDRLMEVDLRERSVRVVRDRAQMLQLAVLTRRLSASATPPAVKDDASAGGEQAQTPARILSNGATVNIGPAISVLAVRSADRVEIVNPVDNTSTEFVLPAELRRKDITIYTVPDDLLLAVNYGGKIDADVRSELTWFSADGRITRQESVRLAQYQITLNGDAWFGAVAVPVPLYWVPLVTRIFPDDVSRANPEIDRADAVSGTMSRVWPALTGVLLLAACLSLLTYRLQRKYHRPATVAWCVFVFLFGPQGFLAYLIEQRRPKLELCPACKMPVPRDREACAVCEVIFPPPARVGTEIFA